MATTGVQYPSVEGVSGRMMVLGTNFGNQKERRMKFVLSFFFNFYCQLHYMSNFYQLLLHIIFLF